MHDITVNKFKSASRGIFNDCHAPKLPCFKGTLKDGVSMLLGSNYELLICEFFLRKKSQYRFSISRVIILMCNSLIEL
jgi:hypothetical protein